MKSFIRLLTILLPLSLSAGDPPYYAILRPAVEKTDRNYTPRTFHELVNICERILAMVEGEWLPQYYHSWAYVQLAYLTEDEGEKDRYLDAAESSAAAALALSPEEVEILLLDALIAYGRMEINPMARAPVQMPRASAALKKGAALDPRNPRVHYLEGKTRMYKPTFLGGGAAAALPALEKAMECFAAFCPPDDLYPHWGREDTERLVRQCRAGITPE